MTVMKVHIVDCKIDSTLLILSKVFLLMTTLTSQSQEMHTETFSTKR